MMTIMAAMAMIPRGVKKAVVFATAFRFEPATQPMSIEVCQRN
jgi:hypothetical protein